MGRFFKTLSMKIFLGKFNFEKYLQFFCTFFHFYMPTVQYCQVFRTLNAELLTFEKIHTRLVPFTEYNDNFDIRYFKREEQRVLKKVTLEFWMGMPNTLKFFYVKLKQYFKRKRWYSNFTEKNLFFWNACGWIIEMIWF